LETDKAILAFSESEKIKEGLLWATQILNLVQGLPEPERKGGEKVVNTLINMIGHEVKLAGVVSGNEGWNEVESDIDKALLMINSGVIQEATTHLSRALSKVTTTGQRSMTFLKENGLI
jgi:hypothetical protein